VITLGKRKPGTRVVELDTSAEWAKPSRPTNVGKDRAAEERPLRHPPLGLWRKDGGHAASKVRASGWRATTNQVAGLYPFLTAAPLPPVGVPVGIDVYSAATVPWHPVEWLRLKVVSNPNVLATGTPGSGKSTLLKMQILRMAGLGVSTLVSYDIKGEYNVLGDWLGWPTTALGGGNQVRLNPLDGGPLARHLPSNEQARAERLAEVYRRRLGLLIAIVEQRLDRRRTSLEETVLGMALLKVSAEDRNGDLRDPILPEVLDALWELVEHPPAELHVESPTQLANEVRPAALALRNLITDTLSGLFDGQTTHPVDFSKPLQSVDISRLESRGEDAVAIAISCLSTWALAAIEDPDTPEDAPARHIITDELWRLMRYPAQLRKLDAELRLSRSQGYFRSLITHRLSDFEAAALPELARDIAASCATRVLFAQDVTSAPKVAASLGLSTTETEMVSSWGAGERGRFLARIGPERAYVVQTVLSPEERKLTYTNERMRV